MQVSLDLTSCTKQNKKNLIAIPRKELGVSSAMKRDPIVPDVPLLAVNAMATRTNLPLRLSHVQAR